MAKKHVDKYFEDIANQYHELLESIRELEEESSKGLINPDHLENMKTLLEPLKQNYLRISYIMFLLNQPNKKEKEKRYVKANNKLLEKIGKENTLDGIKAENNNVLNNIKY